MKKYIIFLIGLIIIPSFFSICSAKDIGYVKTIEMGVDSEGNNTSEETYTPITIEDNAQNTNTQNDNNSYIYMNPYYGGLYYGTHLNGIYPYYYGYNGYGIRTFTVPGMLRNPPPPPPPPNKPGHHPNKPPVAGGNNKPPVKPPQSSQNNNFPHNHIPRK